MSGSSYGIEADDDDHQFAGHPPLTKACLNNLLDFTVNYLSTMPADQVYKEVNHKDVLLCGDTPLMLAANYGYAELVSFLLKSGARKDITTCKGNVYDQIKEKYERLCKSIAKKDDVDTQTYSSDEVRKALEIIEQFNMENPEIDLQERDKLARVLEILAAHTDPTNVCVVCHSPHHLRQCSKCRAVQYCSKECQLYDWKHGHKQACASMESTSV